MGFIDADQMRRRTRRGPDATELRAQIEAALSEAAEGQTYIEVGHLKDHPLLERELESAGYSITYPYKDMGITARISWAEPTD